MPDITRQQVVDTARSYIGTKFVRSGRSKTAGVDCVGLLTVVGRDLGLDIRDILNYDFEPKPGVFLDIIRSQTDYHPMGSFKPGTIVLLRQSIFPMHAGIIGRDASGATVINANMRARKVIEEPIAKWRSEIIELRDYKGLVN